MNERRIEIRSKALAGLMVEFDEPGMGKTGKLQSFGQPAATGEKF